MFKNKFFVLFILICFSFTSCGKFNPVNDQIDSNSDGSYVIESKMSDTELAENGLEVVYRFQSVSNLIAVKQRDSNSENKISNIYLANNLKHKIEENKKIRKEINNKSSNDIATSNCMSAFCEAEFDLAISKLNEYNLNLKPIQIAVIDSGVIPATSAIEKMLYKSSNISGDTNTYNWLSHATMISSLFAGIMTTDTASPSNVYAQNAKINSIKITFAGSEDTSTKKQYGSMQLAVALDKAVASGAKIVNLSLTYKSKPDENVSFAEKGIMSAAAKQGVFFVAAAGNDGINIDKNPLFPASYDLNNLIVTGSHTNRLTKAISSNYGKTVDLSAQGGAVWVNDKYGNLTSASGTSFAAPLVVSALSMYLGINNNSQLEINEVLNDLFNSSNSYYNDENQKEQIANYGRLMVGSFVLKGIHK